MVEAAMEAAIARENFMLMDLVLIEGLKIESDGWLVELLIDGCDDGEESDELRTTLLIYITIVYRSVHTKCVY